MSMVLEPVDRIRVTVTFLRMDAPPTDEPRPLPAGVVVRHLPGCTVAQYRELYNTVGAPYVWWLRRTMPDRRLSDLLRDPQVSIHVLYRDGVPGGFYELDGTGWPVVNLSYFGLMPHMLGQGIGAAFLRHAIGTAWEQGPEAMTVNTCTADHPRAMPTYLRAGFRRVRELREEWSVPVRLGLKIPAALRI
jgi:GNAT superfamily N-acetyltransferase